MAQKNAVTSGADTDVQTADFGQQNSAATNGDAEQVAESDSDIIDLSNDNELTTLINESDESKYTVIKNYILKLFGNKKVVLSDGRQAVVDKTDAQHISHNANARKTAEISKLGEIFKKAKLIKNDFPADHKKFSHFAYYEATVKHGESTFTVVLNVGKAKNDGVYHIYDLTHPQKRNTAGRINGLARPVGNVLANGVSNDSISNPDEIVKGNAGNSDSDTSALPSDIGTIGKTASALDSTFMNMSESERSKLLAAFEKNTGTKVVFGETVGAEGTYENGVIYVNPNTSTPMTVLKHELTHHLELSVSYADFMNFVFEECDSFRAWLSSKGHSSIASYAKQVVADRAAAGRPLGQNGVAAEYEAQQEILADFCGEMLFRDVNALSELAQKNRNLFQRLWDWVKGLFTRYEGTAIEQELRQIEKRFAQVVQSTNQAANENDSGRKHSIETLPDGRRYVKADRQVIFGEDPKQWEQQIIDYVNDVVRGGHDMTIPTQEGDVLTINGRTAWKLGYRNDTPTGKIDDATYRLKGDAAGHIDELAEVSTFKKSKPNFKPNRRTSFGQDGFDYRTAYFLDKDNSYYQLMLSVGVDGNVKTVYNIGDIKKVPFPVTGSKAKKGTTPSDNTVTHGETVVNTQSMQNGRKYSVPTLTDPAEAVGADTAEQNGNKGTADSSGVLDEAAYAVYNKHDIEKGGAVYGEQREETREAFYRRADEQKYSVSERGKTAFAFARSDTPSPEARQAEQELTRLGVPCVIVDRFEENKEDVTRVSNAAASTARGDAVYINNSLWLDPKETAGHEAFHFWSVDEAGTTFKEILRDNIDFASAEFQEFEAQIEADYFGKKVEVDDGNKWNMLMEEIFAHISGRIHIGDPDNIVRPFLRDYDAVKSAWDQLVNSHANNGNNSQHFDRESPPSQDGAGFFYAQNGRKYSVPTLTDPAETADDTEVDTETDATDARSNLEQFSDEEIRKELQRRHPKDGIGKIAGLKPEDAVTVTAAFEDSGVRNRKGDGESAFAESLQGADIFDDRLKELAATNSTIARYDRIANKDTLSAANKSLNEGGAEFVEQWKKKPTNSFTAEDVAVGFILMSRYQTVGDYSSEVTVAEKLREVGTLSGQAVQLFSILGRMTPEGMLLYAQRELNSAYEHLVKGKTNKWVADHKAQFKLTDEDAEFIRRRVWQAAQLPDGRDKNILLAEVSSRVQEKIPPEKGQAYKAWQRTAMLLNPKTQIRNVLGNATMVPAFLASDFIGTGIDAALGKVTGVRTTAITGLSGKAFKQGLFESWDDFVRDINTRDIQADRFEISGRSDKNFNEHHTGFAADARNRLSKALNALDRFNSFLLEAGDRSFYQMWFVNSLKKGEVVNEGVLRSFQVVGIVVVARSAGGVLR